MGNLKAIEMNVKELLGCGARLDFANERGLIPNTGLENNSYQKGWKGQSQTIFVKGLDTSLGMDEIQSSLEEHFGSCGEIARVSLPKVYETGGSKGHKWLVCMLYGPELGRTRPNSSEFDRFHQNSADSVERIGKPEVYPRFSAWSPPRTRELGRVGSVSAEFSIHAMILQEAKPRTDNRDGGWSGGRSGGGRGGRRFGDHGGRDGGGRSAGRGRGGGRQSAGTASTGKKPTFGDD